MKKNRNKQPQRRSANRGIIVFIVFGVVALCSVMFFSNKKDKAGLDELPMISVPYSVDEIHQFWDENLEKPINLGLIQGMYALPEIREHYVALVSKITTIYGKKPIVERSVTYNSTSKNAGGGAVVRQGQPFVVLFIPSIMDHYKILKMATPSDFTERFEGSVVATLLHELEHLSLNQPENLEGNKKILIQSEAEAWALTCSKVLEAYVRHGKKLTVSESDAYAKWLSCGSANNACWMNFMESRHAEVTKFYR